MKLNVFNKRFKHYELLQKIINDDATDESPKNIISKRQPQIDSLPEKSVNPADDKSDVPMKNSNKTDSSGKPLKKDTKPENAEVYSYFIWNKYIISVNKQNDYNTLAYI